MSGNLAETNGQYRSIVVVDVASFTDPVRTELHQRAVHEGLYELLRTAFDESGVWWRRCRVEDRGDGAIILIPTEFPASRLVDQLPARLLAGLRRHNAKHALEARMQLRVAMNIGPIHENANGVVSQALNLTCRIVDAEPAKAGLRGTGGMLVLIVTDTLYQDVIRHEPAAEPATYHRIDVAVKQTRAVAWMRFPEGKEIAAPRTPRLAGSGFFDLVDALLEIPSVRDNQGRQELISMLRPEIAGAVPYDPRGRLHVVSLVRTCEGHQDGLAELVEILCRLEGDSLAIRRLVEVARNRLSGVAD